MENKMFDFGEAIHRLKDGKMVARNGWNGKGMFLYYVPEASYPAMTDIAKKEWGEHGMVPYGAYIAMKTAQGNVVPWLASQTDMLSEDWMEVRNTFIDYIEEAGNSLKEHDAEKYDKQDYIQGYVDACFKHNVKI